MAVSYAATGTVTASFSQIKAGFAAKEAMKVYNAFDVDNAYVKTKHLSTTGGNGAKLLEILKLKLNRS